MDDLLRHRKSIGKNVRSLRKAAGLTQEQLAEKSDLHCTYISDVERGVENVSLDSLARIAKALKVKLPNLIVGS